MRNQPKTTSTHTLAAIVGLILLVSQSGCYSTGSGSQAFSGASPFQPRQLSQQTFQQPQQYQANYPQYPQNFAQQQPFNQAQMGQAQINQAQVNHAQMNQQAYQQHQAFANQMQQQFDPYARSNAANQVGFQGGANPFGFGRC